jgi:hypothetical protein
VVGHPPVFDLRCSWGIKKPKNRVVRWLTLPRWRPRAILRGMRSPLVALLLIVNLLTCPLSCLGCQQLPTSSVESACATCECCSDCVETAIPASPEPHDSNCACKNCICEGAIVASPVELPQSSDGICWFHPIEIDLRSPISSFFADGHSRIVVKHAFTGSDARIALQSWQI